MEAQTLNQMAGLQFVNPCTGNRPTSKKDCSINAISIGHGATNNKGISFTFRNGKGKFLKGYAQIAICKNRVYFKSVEEGEGMRIVDNKTTSNFYGKICTESKTTVILHDFIGDYDLKYDEYLEFYYIEKDEAKR